MTAYGFRFYVSNIILIGYSKNIRLQAASYSWALINKFNPFYSTKKFLFFAKTRTRSPFHTFKSHTLTSPKWPRCGNPFAVHKINISHDFNGTKEWPVSQTLSTQCNIFLFMAHDCRFPVRVFTQFCFSCWLCSKFYEFLQQLAGLADKIFSKINCNRSCTYFSSNILTRLCLVQSKSHLNGKELIEFVLIAIKTAIKSVKIK